MRKSLELQNQNITFAEVIRMLDHFGFKNKESTTSPFARNTKFVKYYNETKKTEVVLPKAKNGQRIDKLNLGMVALILEEAEFIKSADIVEKVLSDLNNAKAVGQQ